MSTSAAIVDSPLRQADMPCGGMLTGGLAARSINRLFQVCLPSSRLHASAWRFRNFATNCHEIMWARLMMFTRSNLIVIITGHGAGCESVQAAFEGRMALFHQGVGGLVSLSYFQAGAITNCITSMKVAHIRNKYVH
jgi:hypothetical protein